MNNRFSRFRRLVAMAMALALCAMGVVAAADSSSAGIRVNQVGFRPDAVKTAVFAGTGVDGEAFAVIEVNSGETVFEGNLSAAIDNPWAGETNRVADFSGLTRNGTYCVVSADGLESPAFTVGEDVYGELLRSAARMLYLQRCGIETDGALAGPYAHPACHTALATVWDTGEKIDVSGGWHDAGDYGRYVVSGAKAAADLMLAHALRGEILDDFGIPESGDGLDDLLEEAKVELDWLLKMQAASGGVYHKVSCASFPAFIPPEKETGELIVCPVSNTATGDFAAVMAMASRLCAVDWPEDARAYLDAARRAWDYLAQHEGEPGFQNPDGIVTGEYPDDDDSDERFWAAAELASATGEAVYVEAASDLLATGGKRHGLGWLDVGTYGLLAVLNDARRDEDDPTREAARVELDAIEEEALAAIALNPYGADRTDAYEWGSNMGVANTAALLMMEGRRGNEACRRAAQQPLDYLLGKNATGYCFVTATGARSPEHPHHRPSHVAREVMPGMLVGGPNSGLEDPRAASLLRGNPPAKCYVDDEQSYSTNEVCVYWNSPLVLLLAGM
ncbi:MAG: glycoside hydrolase family 9 protein [Clostridia bacterium]|nr:glycoside hydrolase family 9 protein [Clostridia bacterium]